MLVIYCVVCLRFVKGVEWEWVTKQGTYAGEQALKLSPKAAENGSLRLHLGAVMPILLFVGGESCSTALDGSFELDIDSD